MSKFGMQSPLLGDEAPMPGAPMSKLCIPPPRLRAASPKLVKTSLVPGAPMSMMQIPSVLLEAASPKLVGITPPIVEAPTPKLFKPSPMAGAATSKLCIPSPMLGSTSPKLGMPSPMLGAASPKLGAASKLVSEVVMHASKPPEAVLNGSAPLVAELGVKGSPNGKAASGAKPGLPNLGESPKLADRSPTLAVATPKPTVAHENYLPK